MQGESPIPQGEEGEDEPHIGLEGCKGMMAAGEESGKEAMMKTFEGQLVAQDYKFGIVVSRFNEFISKNPVSYTHLRAHETRHDLVCRLLLEKKKKKNTNNRYRKSK